MSFLYREAGRVMKGVEDGRASLKTLTLGRPNSVGGGKGGDENGPKRKLYAMVSETLRYKLLLDELVTKADLKGTFFSAEHVRDKAQAYVMLYEMLLGKGSIQGGGKLKRHVTLYKPRLEECLREAKVAKGLPADAPNDALLPKSARRHVFPRYARVNLATCPHGADGLAVKLREEGFDVQIDNVVPSLLVLPAGTDLHDHPMVKNGRLVLQDKSSCFSAEALLGSEAETAARLAGRQWKSGDVIDACAAPGNKAMHAAYLLSRLGSSSVVGTADGSRVQERRRRGKVFAFDKDARRLDLMRRRVDGAGLTDAIETRLQDFLEVDPSDVRFARVTTILLDPSCSGSGIVSALERVNDVEDRGGGFATEEGEGREEASGDESRIEKLAAFQLRGLLKAMSFPQATQLRTDGVYHRESVGTEPAVFKVQRVCYSTCSVYVRENEDVVAKALEQQPEPTPLVNRATATLRGTEGTTTTKTPNSWITDATYEAAAAVSAAEGDRSAAGEALRPGRFALSRCLPRWPRRGLAVAGLDEAQAACLVRVNPAEDETNGFFVATFEREVTGSDRGESSAGEVTKKRQNRRDKNRKKREARKRKRKRAETVEGSDTNAGGDSAAAEANSETGEGSE